MPNMEKKRHLLFVIVYSLIVASMLFMFFCVQRVHDRDPSNHYHKKYFDKLFRIHGAGNVFPEGVRFLSPSGGASWRLLPK
jgi:Na+/melibiose symporter-like transporter